MALSPVFLALSTLELLTGRVVPVPFDGSTVVEGTVCPTTASSPDAEVRGILATGLKKSKNSSQNQQIEDESTNCNELVTCLLLVICEELLRFHTVERVPVG